MTTWEMPDLPDVPGRGKPVRLFDSAAQAVTPTTPGQTATMYVCGITPYDATHMGHAATYVAFDLLNRAWRDAGHDVNYVQNITDVDDPLLARAQETGQDWRDIADRETRLFRSDMAALRVVPPQTYLGVVAAMPMVIEVISGLLARGHAYMVDEDIYFSLAADPRFGSVSHLSRGDMLALFGERGGDPDRPGKRDPLDPLLWLGERPGEPAWDSPFGRGRPGWHVECVAIALGHLGMAFDVQGGGRDLVFPHHDMGAAQGQAATGEWPYARCYAHAGMVGLDGEKMSKSRGNLVFVSRLTAAGRDPMAIRLGILAHHYRHDWEWTEGVLDDGQRRLDRWRSAARLSSAPAAEPLLERVRDRLSDDLDAPAALAAIDAWCDEAVSLGGRDTTAPGLLARMADTLLGVRLL